MLKRIMMNLYRGIPANVPWKKCVVTIGKFDGLHRGHRRLIRRLVRRAREARPRFSAVVLSFETHPAAVLHNRAAVPLLLDLHEKVKRLSSWGVDALVLVNFTDRFAALSPDAFARDLLAGSLNAGEVVVGEGFRFGRNRRGDVEELIALGRNHGFAVEAVPLLKADGVTVASSTIRNAVEAGAIERARMLLGRRYSISGRVVRGAGFGRRLGYPTANLAARGRLLPADGVYAARAGVGGRSRPALAYVGSRPTVRGKTRGLEVHILDGEYTLSGQMMHVAFLARLRADRAFPSTAALRRGIALDIRNAKRFFLDG